VNTPQKPGSKPVKPGEHIEVGPDGKPVKPTHTETTQPGAGHLPPTEEKGEKWVKIEKSSAC
jgi:hypothetical protein